MKPTKFIAYYRVSTGKQQRSGLGLDGQKACVLRYAEVNNGVIVKSYTEVESGRKNDRPELAKAMAQARREGATLVVAKMDRLTRNAGFMCALCDSGLKFVACDNPGINEMTAKILAVLAEQEAKDISIRTKTALAELKVRGVKLGAARPECRDNLTEKSRLKGARAGADVRRSQADEAYADLFPVVLQMREEGKTYDEIAEHLNGEGNTTTTGTAWGKVQVKRLLQRAARVTGK